MSHARAQLLFGFSNARDLISAGVKFFSFATAPPAVRQECARQAKTTASKTVASAGYIVIFPKGRAFDIHFTRRFRGVSPTRYLIAEPDSRINLFETHDALAATGGIATHILARAHSKFSYSLAQRAVLSKTVEYTAVVGAGATLDFVGFLHCTNEHAVRLTAQLRGRRSVSNIRLALLCSRSSRTVLELRNAHTGGQTSGQILLKAAARDQAALRADGWITVGAKAQKTDSFLREDVLLLSPEAEAKAVPNLEILHHDVRASHSATVGQLTPQQLYYCTARGLTVAQSEKLLTKGFFTELAEPIKNRDLAQRYLKSLTTFL